MKKLTLNQIAAAALLLGIGGTAGNMAATVVSYDYHAQALGRASTYNGQLSLVLADPNATVGQLKAAAQPVSNAVDEAVASFQAIDANAKAAWGRVATKAK